MVNIKFCGIIRYEQTQYIFTGTVAPDFCSLLNLKIVQSVEKPNLSITIYAPLILKVRDIIFLCGQNTFSAVSKGFSWRSRLDSMKNPLK